MDEVGPTVGRDSEDAYMLNYVGENSHNGEEKLYIHLWLELSEETEEKNRGIHTMVFITRKIGFENCWAAAVSFQKSTNLKFLEPTILPRR